MFLIFYYVTILFIVNLNQYEAKYGEDCITTDKTSGQCVPMRSCSNTLSSLTQSSCGRFNNMDQICCEKEKIILNTEGFEILNNDECGYYQMHRVAHGEVAKLSQFPWMTLIKYDDNPPFKCGATLISHRYVLTAAHCIGDGTLMPKGVRLGEHNITSDQDCQKFGKKVHCAPSVEDVGIDEIIVHPNYNQIQNDIALIRLNRRVDFKEHIRAVCLPVSEDLRADFPKDYFISGWGLTENGEASDILKFAVIPHKDISVCMNIFKRADLTSNHICAGGEGKRDSCHGDSGGPIGQVNKYKGHQRFIQYGVVSYAIDSCGTENYPAIYTNVPKYIQWITDTVKDD